MRMVNTVPAIVGGQRFLIGTTDAYARPIDESAWQTLREMGPKILGDLGGRERGVYDTLRAEGRMADEPGVMRLRGTEGLCGVTIESTDACNLRCKHCYLGEKASRTLGRDAYEGVVDDTWELGAYGIAFTGGEVMLDEDIFERIRYAREKDFKVSVTTNATMIGEDDARQFASLGTETVAVTLNGFKDEHEALYGKGTYEPALRGVKRLLAAGNNVRINFNLYKGNQHVLPAFREFCRGLGVKSVSAAPIKAVGWGKNMKDEMVSEPQLCCGKGGKEKIVVKADGRVVPCVFLDGQVMGNVYDEHLKDIYRRHRREQVCHSNGRSL